MSPGDVSQRKPRASREIVVWAGRRRVVPEKVRTAYTLPGPPFLGDSGRLSEWTQGRSGSQRDGGARSGYVWTKAEVVLLSL